MAAPAFETAGTHLQGASRSSMAVDAPASVAVNDIILVGFFHDEATNQTITAPSGFTAAPNCPVNANNHRLHLYWKRATGDGTDDDTDTYTFTWATAVYCEARALRISGCITTGTPFESDTGTAVDNDAPHDGVSPAVSTTTDGADRLIIKAATSWAGGTWTAPTGFTTRVQGNDGLFTMSDKSQASAGSTGSISSTCTGQDKMTGFVGALIPASAGGAVALDGAAPAASSATGGLSADRPLTGVGSAASGGTGQLSADRPLSGAGSAANGATGALAAARPLDGSSAAAAAANASLAADRPLSGTAAAASGATGDLTVSSDVLLDGTAAAASSATGALAVDRPLIGAGPAASGATGTLLLERPLTGAASSADGATGVAIVARPLTGAAAAASGAAGTLTVSGAVPPHELPLTLKAIPVGSTLAAIPAKRTLTALED